MQLRMTINWKLPSHNCSPLTWPIYVHNTANSSIDHKTFMIYFFPTHSPLDLSNASWSSVNPKKALTCPFIMQLGQNGIIVVLYSMSDKCWYIFWDFKMSCRVSEWASVSESSSFSGFSDYAQLPRDTDKRNH